MPWRGGEGFQRPFELATVRLRNMVEVLRHWRTYVPRDDFLTQRGGTFLLESDDGLLYSYRDPGLLGFSATMARPPELSGSLSRRPHICSRSRPIRAPPGLHSLML